MDQRIKSAWDKYLPILFLAPSVAAIAIFVYGFISWTGYVSLSQWKSLVPDFSFAGFQNYVQLFQDFRFQSDLRNTLVFTLLFILGTLGFGFLLATLIDQNIRMEFLFRNVFLFPMALSFVVTGVVWQWVLNPSSGINLLLQRLGVEQVPKWYTDTTVALGFPLGKIEFGIPLAILSVILAAVWQMTGFSLAMYLAGLRAIPEDLREAARVDGATEFQIYRKVIFPILLPITISVTVMMAHISLKIFDLIYAMTGPGSNFVTDVPGVYMFETTFRANNYANGAAIAMIMLVMVALFMVPYLVSSRRGD